MLRHLPTPIIASISTVLMLFNTVFWGMLIVILLPIRFLQKDREWRTHWTNILCHIGKGYVFGNRIIMAWNGAIKWEIRGLEGLDPHGSYLVMCNHRSLVDIPVLQGVLLGKIPFLRFLIKEELIRVPVLGWTLFALGFPSMKRYSKEELKKSPELRVKDLETLAQFCRDLRDVPWTVLLFPEGTRFTEEKHRAKSSSYQNLLTPKSGGLHMMFSNLGKKLTAILDITVSYPGNDTPSYWDLACGRIPHIVVEIKSYQVSDIVESTDMLGKKEGIRALRKWINQCWKEKDTLISKHLSQNSTLL